MVGESGTDNGVVDHPPSDPGTRDPEPSDQTTEAASNRSD